MKAREFRLGNLVTQRLIGTDKTKLVGVDIDVLNSIVNGNTYFDYLPIPLTEEILLKCGFEKVKNKIDIFEKKRLWLWIGSRGECLCYLIEEDTTSGHYFLSIEYLHSLQNLYFALTGEELEVNL